MKKVGLILSIGLFILCFNANIVFAGFGVSPSGVRNHHLLPGSHFEQTIYFVQGKPDRDLWATIEVDPSKENPEIKDWISIDHGFGFTIPAGNQQFPVKVIVDVPQDAEFKNYQGKLWIKTGAKKAEGEGGTVAISIGAIVQLDLTVSTEEIYGFAFRGGIIKDAEQDRSIKVGITLENVGNIEDKPSKITLKVRDVYSKAVLQTSEITKIEILKAFEKKQINVKFPNKLDLGTYFGTITIFKDEHIIGDFRQAFHVLERTDIFYKIFNKWYTWVILWVIILTALVIRKRKKIKEGIKKWKTKKLEKKRGKIEKKIRKLGI